MTQRREAQFTGRARRGGFTMVEFTGALVIAMILSIIAVAGFRVFERELPLRHGSKRLLQAFSTARAFAIARNAYYAVRFDTQAGNFWLDETDSQGNPTLPKVTRPEELGEELMISDVYFGQARADDTQPFYVFQFRPDSSADDVRILIKQRESDPGLDASYDTIRLYGPTAHSEVFSGQRLLPTP